MFWAEQAVVCAATRLAEAEIAIATVVEKRILSVLERIRSRLLFCRIIIELIK